MTFIDLFAGIGGFRLGMEQAGHICVGHCEIDKFANKSYIAMYKPKEGEWYASDITRIRTEDIPKCDCWCFGFPCQDISVAGKQQGLRGNRSSLFYAVTELIRGQKEENKPSYLFIENVKNLLSINKGVDFAQVLVELDEIGYDAEWAVINSADVVPQNRERVFIIGHLRGRSTRQVFPIRESNSEVGNTTKLKLFGLLDGKNSQSRRVYDSVGISPTLDVSNVPKTILNGHKKGIRFDEGVIHVREGTLKGYAEAHIGDSINFTAVGSKTRRGRVGKNRANTLDTQCNQAIIDAKTLKMRKLTPKECFRLQGFPDDYFDRAREVNSDNQLYKQAGNSVTVPVIYEIAKKMKV